MKVMVCGAHMQGLPLNHQMLELDAEFLEETTTSANYQLFALAGGPPYRPGLIRNSDGGQAIAVEVWQMPVANLGKFIQQIPEPLGLGSVELISGERVIGFICQPEGIKTANDISQYQGWRNYLASLKS
jgi:allophanate hydrolase